MEGGALTFTTLGLGSTLGLVIVAFIGLSGSSGETSSSSGPVVNLILEYVSHGLRSVSSRETRDKLGNLLVDFICDYVFVFPRSVFRFVRAVKHEYRRAQDDYQSIVNERTWRNVCKLLRILKIWEPLPYDLMVGQPKSELAVPFENKIHEGLVGVCLRFRMGPLRSRINRHPCEPHSVYWREWSVPAYFPLEGDGSLSVDLIRKTFYVEELELLIPGRYDSIRVTKGDSISPLLLHQLTQEWNSVNFVEYEDDYCQKRRRFRQWLRGTRMHYFIRVFCYIAAHFTIATASVMLCHKAASTFPGGWLWWLMCHCISIAIAIVGSAVFIEYRKEKLGTDEPWHMYPQRHSVYWLSDRVKGTFL